MKNTPQESLEVLFSKMDEFVSTKTVVGEPIAMGDVTIIPLVDVSFGMATGVGSTKDEDPKGKNAGAGGMGAKMSPSAVIVVSNGTAQLVNVKSQDSVNKLVDLIPGILQKFNLGSFLKKKEEEETVEIVIEEGSDE